MNLHKAYPIKHKRFFWKNLASLMAISLIPVLLLGVLAIVIVNVNSRRDIRASNQVMLNQAREMVEYVFGELDTINIIFSTSSSIVNSARNILRHDGGISFEDLQILRILQNVIDGPVNSRSYIHSIYIYFDDSPHRFLSSGVGIINTEAFTDTDWIEDYLNQPHDIETWTQLRGIHNNLTDTRHDSIISIHRRIHFPGWRRPEGVAVLNLRADYINSLLANFRGQPDNVLFVKNKDGNVLFSSTGNADPICLYSIGNSYEVVQLYSQRYQWDFFSITPRASLYDTAFNITSVTVAIILGLSLVILISAFRINRGIYSGLYSLVEIFDAAQHQRPLPPMSSSKKNEYFYIAQNIVKTFVEQDYLKMQLSERKYRLQAMELGALKLQINPHFLFNVLETLYWKVFSLTGSKNEANTIMEHLSDILKYSLYGQSDSVSLREEVKYTENYLAIQKLRFSERLNVSWKYSEFDHESEVPKMILQPIIENCINHGINEASGKGRIDIRLCLFSKGNVMNIKIIDNGVGIPSDRLQHLRNSLELSDGIPGEHIGLLNTHKRLVLLYGDEYGIKIRSKEGIGTTVHLMLPYRTK